MPRLPTSAARHARENQRPSLLRTAQVKLRVAALAGLVVTVAAATAVTLAAQATPARDRSTADGVYTRAQADQGREVFALACQSCHAPTQHAGNTFRGNWFGKSLWALFDYLRWEMPQTDPGTLSDDEYVALVAYLMQINRMPTGPDALAADSSALAGIRIDSLPSAAGAARSVRR